jgi:hypothetical protein
MPQVTQYAATLKSGTGPLTITFPTVFKAIPTVVASPFWQNSTVQVSFPETIVQVTPESFTVTSDNADSTYFVSWIAVSG